MSRTHRATDARGGVTYRLSTPEKKDLRLACRLFGQDFHAMAARPRVARELIGDMVQHSVTLQQGVPS